MSSKLARDARQAATRAAQERMKAEIDGREETRRRAAAADAERERAVKSSTGD